jgi:hypothetical protein
MFFLIRMAFWFSLVLLVLPLDAGDSPDGTERVGAIQAFFAASQAVDDVTGICERRPTVCETGKAAMHTISVRAREGARIAFEMLDDEAGQPDTATQTGGIKIAD